MSQQKSSTAEHTFMAFFALGLVVIIFRIASWVISGVYNLVTAVFWGITYLALFLLALLVLAALLCMLAWIQERWKERQDFLSALGRAEFPTKSGFESGMGANVVEQIFITVLSELYEDKFAPLQRRLSHTEFSYLKFKLFRIALKKPRYRAIIEQEVYSPLLSLWNSQSNNDLNQWVEEAISSERRRKFFFLVSILLFTLSSAFTFGKFTIGYSSDKKNLYYYRDVGELRSSQTQFFRFMWKHGLPNLRFISQILLPPEENPAPSKLLTQDSQPLLPESTETMTPTQVEADIIEADFVDPYEESEAEIQQQQLEQEAIEQFKSAKNQLFYDCPDWEDAELHLMVLGDIFDDLIVEGLYPQTDDCEDMLLVISEALQRLPFFEGAFEACLYLDPDEAFQSLWMQQVSAEFSSGEIESCLSNFRRIAVRCFVLASDSIPTDFTPIIDEVVVEAEQNTEPPEAIISDTETADSTPIEPEANTADLTTAPLETLTKVAIESEIVSKAPKIPANGVQNPSLQPINAPIGF